MTIPEIEFKIYKVVPETEKLIQDKLKEGYLISKMVAVSDSLVIIFQKVRMLNGDGIAPVLGIQ